MDLARKLSHEEEAGASGEKMGLWTERQKVRWSAISGRGDGCVELIFSVAKRKHYPVLTKASCDNMKNIW